MKRKSWILICIAVLFVTALALRVYRVDSAPSGSTVDEASFGINAYSILKTGKDEHGSAMPLVFKAFGDEKLPVYAYATVPFIKIFGLNNLSVRLPSVIAGSLMGIIMFLLLLELGFTMRISFLGSLIAITSPWSLILGRFGYESNIGLLFLLTGIYFSLVSYRKKNSALALLGGLFFGATWYSYIAYRLVTPFIAAAFFIFYFVKGKKVYGQGLVLLAAFLITVSPFVFSMFSPQGTARLRQTGFMTDTGIVMSVNESRSFCSTKAPRLLCYLGANKLNSYLYTYASRYIASLSPDYLFTTGDSKLTYMNVDNYGLFYLILAPFYLAGLYALFNRFLKRQHSKMDLVLLIGMIIAPLPAILASDPQKVRLSPLFPFAVLVMTYGLELLDKSIRSPRYKSVALVAVTAVILGFTAFFMTNLIAVHTSKYEIAFGSYIPKLMRYLDRQDKKTKIYIKSIAEGLTFYAYVNKTDPTFFQKNAVWSKPDAIGFSHPVGLGNVVIADRDIYAVGCMARRNNEDALYVTNEDLSLKLGKAQKIFRTENGVDTLAFVYNLGSLNFNDFDCSTIR